MKMHWCSCRINLAGQGHHVVVFDPTQAVSWPEVQVLMALHGDENVFEIKPVRLADNCNARREKDRLFAKYGKIVEKVFPGNLPRMEALMPGHDDDQLQLADAEGDVINETGDDDDGGGDHSLEPPTGPATFKPSRHARPTPGA